MVPTGISSLGPSHSAEKWTPLNTSLHRSYELVRPSAPHRYSRLVASTTCASPFTSERLVPAVPHKSLDQLHAPFTPVAACPVIRFPTGLSQEIKLPLVLTASLWITTRHRKVHFRSSLWSIPARGITPRF